VKRSQTKTNIPASVRQRLLNRARKEQRPLNELLQYYAMERFLYRLSVSPYKDHFILKGALMLQVWGSTGVRSTMDIDLLGKTSNKEAIIVSQIWDILQIRLDDDGLLFDTASITSERITEDADYIKFCILTCVCNNDGGFLFNSPTLFYIPTINSDSVTESNCSLFRISDN